MGWGRTGIGITVLMAMGCVLDPGGATEGSGNVVEERRALVGATGVRIYGQGVVRVERSDTPFVLVRTDDNLLPLIETTVRNGVLVIQPRAALGFRELSYVVGLPQTRLLELHGTLSGEAPELDEAHLHTALSGTATLRLGGRTGALNLLASGAVGCDALALLTDTTRVTAMGDARVTVWAEARLDVTASGVAEIRYRGRPEIHASLSGSATLVPVG